MDTEGLRATLLKNRLTVSELAILIGMTPDKLESKMRSGRFNTDEVIKIVRVLGIKNPAAIFFTEWVT